jgi:HSP20 family protein
MDIDKKKNQKTQTQSTKGYIYSTPDCDIYETDNDYKMIYDIPGVEKNDINIRVEKDVLTVTADCTKQPVEGYQDLKKEMKLSGYKRSFDLNNTVNTDKINADYTDGILTLTLPKKEEQKTKEVKINIS